MEEGRIGTSWFSLHRLNNHYLLKSLSPQGTRGDTEETINSPLHEPSLDRPRLGRSRSSRGCHLFWRPVVQPFSGGTRRNGVQAGYDGQVDRAIRLHGRSRRGISLSGSDPGRGWQSLRHYGVWRQGVTVTRRGTFSLRISG